MAIRKPTRFVILKPQHITRPKVGEGGKLTTRWVRDPNFGVFSTRNEAKVAWLLSLMPELTGLVDELVLRHWAGYARRGYVKIGRTDG